MVARTRGVHGSELGSWRGPRARGRLALLVAAALALGPAGTARPATFTVNSAFDQPDAFPGDGVCDFSPPFLECSLRAAIMEANALAGSDTVDIPDGDYPVSLSGSGEDAAFTGDLDITEDLDIIGQGIAVDIMGSPGDRVFHVLLGVTASITSVNIMGGAADGVGLDGLGGGILNQGSLTLTLVRLEGNAASVEGAGIYNADTADLRLEDQVRIEFNISLVGSLVHSLANFGTLIANEVLISGGGPPDLGGLLNSGPPAIASLTEVRIFGHTDVGIRNEDGATLTLEASILDGNLMGILQATSAGPTAVTVINSTISGNQSNGIENATADTSVLLRNVTIADHSGAAAGIRNTAGGSVTLRNTILADNGTACFGNLISEGYNLIESTLGCTIGGDLTGNVLGRDPLLSELRSNGGPTLNMAPSISGPAVNAGHPGLPGSGGFTCEALDQRTISRVGATRCDIGAVELEAGPTLLGRQICEFDPNASTLVFETASGPLASVPLVGRLDIDCGAQAGAAVCSCELVEVEPISVAGLATLCIQPVQFPDPIGPGLLDCDGTNLTGFSLTTDHLAGICTGNADCASQCVTYCGTRSESVLDSGCEGYCRGGTNDGVVCSQDSACPGGQCNGLDPTPHLGPGLRACGCTCVGSGAPGPSGGLICNLGLSLSLETALPCDGLDVLSVLGATGAPATTLVAVSTILNANLAGMIPAAGGPSIGSGIPIDCPTFATGDLTGTELLVALHFIDLLPLGEDAIADMRMSCVSPAVCGNGIPELDEACDDGNVLDGDGCSGACTVEPGFVCTRGARISSCSVDCGDGLLTPPEECDDGGTADEDGCSSSCQLEFCGDGLVQVGLGEVCDDGNTVSGDGCSSDCLTEICGDGLVTGGEECDDGNAEICDGCLADCTLETFPDDTDGDGLGGSCDPCPNDPFNDIDGDGFCADVDNCPTDPDPSQADGDEDGVGDVCDNCPGDSNPDQLDFDADGEGDACDGDNDDDGVPDGSDNCPLAFNPGQEDDGDGDGIGDACDACPTDATNDADGDGACEDVDNCPGLANPLQSDPDGDGLGAACDNCPSVSNAGQADTDGDSFGDVCDNCPARFNVDQLDTNGDGRGDACEPTVVILQTLLSGGGGEVPLGGRAVTRTSHVTSFDVQIECGAADIRSASFGVLQPGGVSATAFAGCAPPDPNDPTLRGSCAGSTELSSRVDPNASFTFGPGLQDTNLRADTFYISLQSRFAEGQLLCTAQEPAVSMGILQITDLPLGTLPVITTDGLVGLSLELLVQPDLQPVAAADARVETRAVATLAKIEISPALIDPNGRIRWKITLDSLIEIHRATFGVVGFVGVTAPQVRYTGCEISDPPNVRRCLPDQELGPGVDPAALLTLTFGPTGTPPNPSEPVRGDTLYVSLVGNRDRGFLLPSLNDAGQRISLGVTAYSVSGDAPPQPSLTFEGVTELGIVGISSVFETSNGAESLTVAQVDLVAGADRPEDTDGDLNSDDADNCPFFPNPLQLDRGRVNSSDPDKIGDLCQCGESTLNGIVEPADVGPLLDALVGDPIDAGALARCSVIGGPECDILDVVIVNAATNGGAALIAPACAPANAP